MPSEIMMPRLGWDMERGVLGQWLKQDGEHVEAGDMLFTVESDKATQEVEALDGGTLYIPPDSPPPGSDIAVGTLLAYILQRGEQAPGAASGASTATAASQIAAALERGGVATSPASAPDARGSRRSPAISPRARRVAAEMGIDWSVLSGSGRTGRIVERDVRHAYQGARPRVSPLARALAGERGVDLEALARQHPGRRIEVADVEQASVGTPLTLEPTAPPAPASSAGQRLPGQRLPMSQVRQIISARMAASARATAPVTLTTEADATEMVKLREQLRAAGEAPVPSYTDIMAKLVAQLLQVHPALNARLEGDAIFQASVVNMGIAVDTDRGLLVPVVRDAHARSVLEIAQASADLIARARQGKLQVEELEGGTFTLTNLGMYEIDAFTPIINLPECAVLGLGRIVAKPVVVDPGSDRVEVRKMMFLSLTFDHRLVDGAPAARFLQQIKAALERPASWLFGLR